MRRSYNALAGLIALTAVAVAFTPTVQAAHTCPYLASGTATPLLGGPSLQASLYWSGQVLGCNDGEGNWFILDLADDSGGIVVHDRFLGASNEAVAVPDECGETIDPYVAVGATPAGFVIEGRQRIDFCTGIVTMHYEGVYGQYHLVLDVWAPFF